MWHETILTNAGMSSEFPAFLRNTGSKTMLTISQLPSVAWRNLMIFQLLYPTLICKILTDVNSLILFCKQPSRRRTSISPKSAVQFPESESAAVRCRSVSTTGLSSSLSMAHSQHVSTVTVTHSSKVRRPISSSRLSVKQCTALLRCDLIYRVREKRKTCAYIFFLLRVFWLLFNLVYWKVISC
jgi:hypothetical protein